jgi:hypothetical protein
MDTEVTVIKQLIHFILICISCVLFHKTDFAGPFDINPFYIAEVVCLSSLSKFLYEAGRDPD